MPVGARAKGFLAFGDALFLRRIDSVKSIARSTNEQHLMLLKLAFVALNFGYLEYALLVLDAAEQTKPDSVLSGRLMSRDCYRLLYELRQAAEALPAGFLHTQRSELVAERRKMVDHGYLGAAKEHAARGRMAATRLGRALRRLIRPVWRRLRNAYVDLGPGTPVQRTTAAAASLPPGATHATARPAASPAGAVPPSIEQLLESYGYSWLAYEVRHRRRDAERYVAGRLH
jgi:hypothetical protein